MAANLVQGRRDRRLHRSSGFSTGREVQAGKEVAVRGRSMQTEDVLPAEDRERGREMEADGVLLRVALARVAGRQAGVWV